MKKFFWILFSVALFIPLMGASARGAFAYITIKGPYLNGEVTSAAPALVDAFDAFADFSGGPVEAPAAPGDGYGILRFVAQDANKVIAFDEMHYYPDTGYLFYDGLAEGTSEYDGKWFRARPEVEAPFRNVLVQQTRLMWITLGLVLIGLAVFAYFYFGKNKAVQK